jgi:hypothetical protein
LYVVDPSMLTLYVVDPSMLTLYVVDPSMLTVCVVDPSMLTLYVVDPVFEPRLHQTKDYKIGICCLSAKHAVLRSKSKD